MLALAEDSLTDCLADRIKTGKYNDLREIAALCKEIDDSLLPQEAENLASMIVGELNQSLFPAISHLELFLTYECSLKCDYCFADPGITISHQSMSWETARKAVDFLYNSSSETRDVSLLFFGGEPLLKYDLIKRIVIYAKRKADDFGKRPEFNLTTNGILLDREKLDFFKEYNVKFLLSMDGNKIAHDRHRKLPSGEGSYDIIVEKIPLFKEYQPWLGVRMTISPDVVDYLCEGFLELVELGINQFLISPTENIEWPSASVCRFYSQLENCVDLYFKLTKEGKMLKLDPWEQMKKGDFLLMRGKWGCRAGRQGLAVDTDGGIYPCSKMLFPGALKKICKLGSLNDGLDNIGLRMKLCDLIHQPRLGCVKCPYEITCTGGCYAANFWENGDMFNPIGSYHCNFVYHSYEMYKKLRCAGAL
jgi:uncharacterized protein